MIERERRWKNREGPGEPVRMHKKRREKQTAVEWKGAPQQKNRREKRNRRRGERKHTSWRRQLQERAQDNAARDEAVQGPSQEQGRQVSSLGTVEANSIEVTRLEKEKRDKELGDEWEAEWTGLPKKTKAERVGEAEQVDTPSTRSGDPTKATGRTSTGSGDPMVILENGDDEDEEDAGGTIKGSN
jgi:hypothetical protein